MSNTAPQLDDYYERKAKYFHINNFVADGFQKVCDVVDKGDWYYTNINHDLMWADHASWVYMIVLNTQVVKVGETGNPLGIKSKQQFQGWIQPKAHSSCRLGRLRNGDGTDSRIRCGARNEVADPMIEIWARKCPIVKVQSVVKGQQCEVVSTIHKELELQYLAYFLKRYHLPRLNCINK